MTEIAIVGLGSLFPGAADTESFWRNICSGVDAITEVPESRWDRSAYYRAGAYSEEASSDRFYCRRGGFIDDLATFDPVAFGIMPSAVDGTEPDQLLALKTAAAAIADAGGESALPDRSRIGVVIGRGGYITPASARLDQRVRTSHQLVSVIAELIPGVTSDQLDAVRQAFQEQLGPQQPEASIGIVPNFAASRIANRFDFQGPAYTVDAACASSLVAIDSAVHELESGRCDVVLAGGVHHCHLATLWSVFTQLRALSRSQQIRPFDRRADGTLMSEGTGIVVLKRLEDARKNGDRIYAVIRGVGLSSDGRASSLMSPRAEGQVLAMERAWQNAGLDPSAQDSLGLLEAHGTGTPAGDRVELQSLRSMFGPRGSGAPAGFGTVKSMIGHSMPAAGIAGLIKAALAVHHGVLPPTLHLEEPRPELAETRFRPIQRTEPWDSSVPRRAGVNAFGFGGINAHVVLEEAEPAITRRTTLQPPEMVHEEPVLLLAGSAEEILKELEAPDERLLDRAGSLRGSGPCRLAVVAPDARKLALARKVVARGTPWRGRSDIWFTSRPLVAAGGKVAYLFPGIVSEFDPQLDDLASHFRIPSPPLSLSRSTMEHARDVMSVGLFLHRVLANLGVQPDLIAGHSLGEWTAMIASGMCEPSAIDTFINLLAPGDAPAPSIKHAALGCPADQVRTVIKDFDSVWISLDNCPHQTVVCGSPDAVDAVVGRLTEDAVIAQELPFEIGFHTPVIAPFLEEAGQAYGKLPVQPPRVPVWSATSVDPYPEDPDLVRDLVFRHLVEGVRFRELAGRLFAEGARVFVELGPGSLTGFIDDSLRGQDVMTISAHSAGRSGLAQIRRLVAGLWVEGAAVDIASLLATKTKSATTVKLNLGSPIVKLNGAAAPLQMTMQGSTSFNVPAGGHPVLDEFAAVLRDAHAAADAVARAWQAPPVKAEARGSIEKMQEFSLRTMPYLRDHCLIDQPADWPDLSDRLPVEPMTTLLEVMAESALELHPGKVVTGFSDVQARRWLVVEPPTTTPVRAADDGPGRVKVTIGDHASGVVLLAGRYPTPPPPSSKPLTGPREAPVSAESLYRDRWMFHGPLFAGVTGTSVLADDGLIGEIEVLPAPGATMDSAGQLIGHWAQVALEKDRTVFPTGMDSLTIYRPPTLGERLKCIVRIRSLSESHMRSDAELTGGDGTVFARIEGWTTRRFSTNERIWAVKKKPESELIGEVQPGGWVLVREGWDDVATRNLMMRRYLNSAERLEYEHQGPRAQREWLLGRMAAKDAARHWLWEHGHKSMYPCEVTVSNDTAGRPFVTGAFVAPQISISHKKGVAVAIAGDRPVGIDLESLVSPGAAEVFLTPEEIGLLESLEGDPGDWLRCFWAAKEAVAKQAGTGLRGRPRDFVVTKVGGEVLTVEANGTTRVATCLLDGVYTVAWTLDGGDEQ